MPPALFAGAIWKSSAPNTTAYFFLPLQMSVLRVVA